MVATVRLVAALWAGLAISILLVGFGEAASPSDRAALIGLWAPEDGTARTIVFKPDGEFDYKYFATLRLRWELTTIGRVDLSTTDGGVKLSCYYTIEGDRLRIDDGSGNTCVTPAGTPRQPMPLSFRRGS